MLYFSIVIGICAIYALVRKYSLKYFICLSFFSLFILAALRDWRLWIDLIGYERRHTFLATLSSWKDFLSGYLLTSKDVGFYVTEWIATKLGISFQIWISIIAAFFLFAVGRLIYRKSYYPLISILLFLALEFYSFSMSGLRQTVAMALTILAYEQLDNDRNVRFILLTLFATLFHRSAIVFIILLFLKNIRLGKYHIIGAIIGLLGFFVFNAQLRAILNSYFFVGNYSYYSSSTITLNYTGFIILLAIFIFCLYYYPNIKWLYDKGSNENNDNKMLRINKPLLLYNAAFLGMVFRLYSSFFAEMFRVSMYFSLYTILLVPLALFSEKKREQRALFMFFIFILRCRCHKSRFRGFIT